MSIRRAVGRVELLWRSRIVGLLLPIAASLGLYRWWWLDVPSPGRAVTFMAVAAVVMAFRHEPSGLEKLLWVGVVVFCYRIELRAIDSDRAKFAMEQQASRTEQRRQMRDILTSEHHDFGDLLKTTQDNFAKTLEQSQQQFSATTSNFAEVLNTATGGDSFPQIQFVLVDDATARATVLVHGRYVLRDLSIRIYDPRELDQAIAVGGATLDTVLSVGAHSHFPNVTSRMVQLLSDPVTFAHPNKDEHFLQVDMSAQNGVWVQTTKLRKVGEAWLAATKIVVARGNDYTKVIYQHTDKGFPLKPDRSVDWSY